MDGSSTFSICVACLSQGDTVELGACCAFTSSEFTEVGMLLSMAARPYITTPSTDRSCALDPYSFLAYRSYWFTDDTVAPGTVDGLLPNFVCPSWPDQMFIPRRKVLVPPERCVMVFTFRLFFCLPAVMISVRSHVVSLCYIHIWSSFCALLD